MNLSDLNVSHSGVKYADFRRKKKFLIQFGIHKFDFSTRLSNQCITMEPSWLLLISFFIPLQAFPTILLSFFLTY